MAESETLTGTTGQYSFTGLRAGNYTVEISGFDDEDVGFGSTTSSADLDVGESQVVTFEGTYLRASSIMGQVGIEGTGLADVTVSLQGKGETREMPTNGAGQFLFEDLRRGDYAIGISGYDDDEYGFEVTSKSVHVPYGETENVPFEGIALRTAEIRGVIAIDGMGPLEGVTVSLTGKGDDPDPVVTMGDGRFSFDRLHAGDYTLSIFGYDTDEYGFDVTSQNVTVALKETATLEFDGIMLRTAAIEGMVTVKGDGLKDVTVTVAGGPKDEEHEAMTNSAGMYDVGDLHAGDYSVTISGYDTKEYGFEVTTKSVSVGLRETAEVAFDGILLRTAGVSGRVTIDGDAMSGLTVTLAGEEDRSGMTNSDGQYAFSGLAAGDYTLTLSGYDTDEYEFDPSMMNIDLELDEAAIANFEGRSLRTVVVMGTVSAEGDALMNVGVTLIKVLGATTGEVLGAMVTDEDGGYMFGELLAGVYRIDLGETDDEYAFATKTRMGSVATDETAMWDFDATIIRTASVGGMVTVDGDGMGGIMVMLTGDHDTEMEMETGSNGMYEFDGLRKGDYTVSIMNPDEDMYDFPTTERMVSLAVGQAQEDISFAGSMNRRASISGQVHVEGDGLEGVTVTLDGDAEDETMTDGNGEYNFPGLAGGDYEVEIENPDEDAYIFDVTEVEVEDLGDETAEIVDFAGEHTTTASVSGMLFVDEVKVDSMHTDGEPVLAHKGFPLLLQGPGVNDSRTATTDSAGMYSFDGLKAGTYNVVIDLNDQLKAALDRAGYAFSGRTLIIGIEVPAATDVDINLPFRITRQTINAGALLANNAGGVSFPVGGVSMALYPTAEDAQDGTNGLGTATTRSSGDHMGVATFNFDRADDKGPGGGPIDYLVYAKVQSTPTDLVAHNDAVIEIEYEAVDRVSHAPTVAKLINTRVNFQWWVKSNETAKDGNEFLGGWVATNGRATNSRGLATHSVTLTETQMTSVIAGRPVRFTVAMNTNQADSVDGREKWTQSRSLSHTHTGLENPATNTMAANDLGAIYVTWQTHSLVLGVYREADDVEGYTNYQSRLPGGDHRPVSSVAREMKLLFLEEDDRGRDKPYKYDHDACWNTNSAKTEEREVSASFGSDGLAKVSCLPRNDEFTIKFTPDTASDPNRVEVGIVAEKLHGYLEPYNEYDMTVSGSTVGTFGDGSGGVHEVRICLSSEGTSDEECATWGYQWETGSIVGNVGDQRGHKLHIEPTTENHGADSTSTSSGTDGVYTIAGLRDGVYDITAYSTRTYRVNGKATQTDMVVYHDETTDDDDTLTKYIGTAAQDTAKWTTTRLGLKVMGYIGNDVNQDDKFRGDESVAGITVRLSGAVSMTTTTDERGFYMFEDLPAGSYTVTPSTSTYVVNRGYRRSGTRYIAYTNWRATAQEYPTLTEGEFDLPYWSSYTTRTLANSTERVCDDADPPNCATLYNFGLLYKDGEVEGSVNNLSGSASGIDLIFTNDFTEVETKITLGFSGEYTRTGLEEGSYSAHNEDAGWAVPCMTSSSSSATPDDDGPKNDDGTCRYPASTTATATIQGKDDFESMTVLHVYDENESNVDRVTSPTVSGKMHGTTAANYDSAARWPAGLIYDAAEEETKNTTSLGTISWASATVSFSMRAPTGGKTEITSGNCTGFSFFTCTLSYNRTGSSSEGEARENTITAMVTAENGYDDHEYSFVVARAAPVSDHLEAGDVIRLDDDGDDTGATATGDEGTTINGAWHLYTEGAGEGSADVRINLATLGSLEAENAVCAQSLAVMELNTTDTIDAEDAMETDICETARYDLDADALYELHVTSQDSVDEVYYLEVIKPGEGTDATLASLSATPGGLNETFAPTTDTYSVDVDHDVEQVTFEWETTDDDATAVPDPADADTGEDGHQLALNAAGMDTELTITVTAEDGETEMTYTVTVSRAVVPGSDATLASLSMDGPGLNETFSSSVTDYTADVGHDVTTATFTFATTDSEATTDPATSPHAAVLGAAGSDTDVEITVTAEDGSTEMTYTITVSRAADPVAGVVLMAVDSVTPFSEEMTEGETDTVQVTLAVAPSADSTVQVTITAGTGLTIVSGSPMDFTDADWEDEQELVVTAANDADADEADPVDLMFSMNGDAGNGYGDTATADDGRLVDTVEVTILETDTRGITLTATAKEVIEADAGGTYAVGLTSAPPDGDPVTIRVSGEPSGVTLSPRQLQFTGGAGGNWETAQTVTITRPENADTADYTAFDLTHTVLGGNYDNVPVDDVSIQVLDDEKPQVAVTTTAVTVDEGGAFTYTIALTQAPSSGETVTMAIGFNTADFESDGGETTVTFTDADFDEAVTITARNVTADAVKTITHTITNVVDTNTEEGSETVYSVDDPASDITVTVKNLPDDS